jgi:hypothetical protein
MKSFSVSVEGIPLFFFPDIGYYHVVLHVQCGRLAEVHYQVHQICCCYAEQQAAEGGSPCRTPFVWTILFEVLMSFIMTLLCQDTTYHAVLFGPNIPSNFPACFCLFKISRAFLMDEKKSTVFLLRSARHLSYRRVTCLLHESLIASSEWPSMCCSTVFDSLFLKSFEKTRSNIFERCSFVGVWGARIFHAAI